MPQPLRQLQVYLCVLFLDMPIPVLNKRIHTVLKCQTTTRGFKKESKDNAVWLLSISVCFVPCRFSFLHVNILGMK